MDTKIYFAIVILTLFLPHINAVSCSITLDCDEGYCEKGLCITPYVANKIIGGCEKTLDCNEGYCINKECILPIENEISNLLWLKSGCSGLFLCPENDVICFIMCNIIWVIVLVMASVAGYITKNYKNKIIPFIYFLLPILIAIVSLPIAGIIISIIEILSIKYEKLKVVKEKVEELFYTEYLPETKKTKRKK